MGQTLHTLITHLTEQGDITQGIVYARRLLTLEPWREAAHRQLMLLLAQDGQRSAALNQFETCTHLLVEELGVEPGPETVALYERIRAGDLSQAVEGRRVEIDDALAPAVSIEPASTRHNLPAPPTPFIGRKEALTNIKQFLLDPSDHRLLTLVGSGGIGKTRLALAAASAVLDAFPHGVYFVSLAPLQASEHIVPALADSIGIHFYGQEEPKLQLLHYLGQKQMLLVMDNFEHLIPDADLIVEMMQAAPAVKILVTSRERLELSGETAFTVERMAYPDADRQLSSMETVSDYGAVKLLLQQARRVRPNFTPQAHELDDAARICHLVQGIPLAIVLAASWLDTLSLSEIADEVAQSLDFLETELRDIPDRQRSMRTVFTYSWNRLAVDEQRIFMKLCFFRGGFTRQAAETVGGAGLRALRRLIHKSFITSGQRGRFEVHELLRQYGQGQVQASSEAERIRQTHSDYYLAMLHQREADLKGHNQVRAIQEIEAGWENIRAAWNWAIQQPNEAGIAEATEGLHLYCDIRGLYTEGIEFFRLARRQLSPTSGERPKAILGKLISRLSFMKLATMMIEGELEADIRNSLTIAKQHKDEAEIAFCKLVLGAYTFFAAQNAREAMPLFEQSLDQFRALNESFYASRVLGWMASCSFELTGMADYEKFTRQSLKLARQIDNKFDINIVLVNLSELSFTLGRYGDAENYIQEAITLTDQMDWTAGKTYSDQVNWTTSRAYIEIALGLSRLLQGKPTETKKHLDRGLAVARDRNYAPVLTYGTALFSLWAGLTGDAGLSRQYGHESLALPRKDPFILMLANWGLSISHCHLQQYAAARQYLQEAFNQVHTFGSQAMKTWLLPVAAVILAGEGQKERAVELLALASTHPLSPIGWMKQWPLLNALQARLATECDSAPYQTLWARGQSLVLETVVTKWLAGEASSWKIKP